MIAILNFALMFCILVGIRCDRIALDIELIAPMDTSHSLNTDLMRYKCRTEFSIWQVNAKYYIGQVISSVKRLEIIISCFDRKLHVHVALSRNLQCCQNAQISLERSYSHKSERSLQLSYDRLTNESCVYVPGATMFSQEQYHLWTREIIFAMHGDDDKGTMSLTINQTGECIGVLNESMSVKLVLWTDDIGSSIHFNNAILENKSSTKESYNAIDLHCNLANYFYIYKGFIYTYQWIRFSEDFSFYTSIILGSSRHCKLKMTLLRYDTIMSVDIKSKYNSLHIFGKHLKEKGKSINVTIPIGSIKEPFYVEFYFELVETCFTIRSLQLADCSEDLSAPVSCSNKEFLCSTGVCIDQSFVCDGVKDCFYGDDENPSVCKKSPIDCDFSDNMCGWKGTGDCGIVISGPSDDKNGDLAVFGRHLKIDCSRGSIQSPILPPIKQGSNIDCQLRLYSLGNEKYMYLNVEICEEDSDCKRLQKYEPFIYSKIRRLSTVIPFTVKRFYIKIKMNAKYPVDSITLSHACYARPNLVTKIQFDHILNHNSTRPALSRKKIQQECQDSTDSRIYHLADETELYQLPKDFNNFTLKINTTQTSSVSCSLHGDFQLFTKLTVAMHLDIITENTVIQNFANTTLSNGSTQFDILIDRIEKPFVLMLKFANVFPCMIIENLQLINCSEDYSTKSVNCSDNEFRCLTGDCIWMSSLCNQVSDCFHGDDENDAVCGVADTWLPAILNGSGKESSLWTLLVAAVGSILSIVLLSLAVRGYITKRNPKSKGPKFGSLRVSYNSLMCSHSEEKNITKSYSDPIKNTDVFSAVPMSTSLLYEKSMSRHTDPCLMTIDRSRIKLQSLIGKGAFGEVYSGLLSDVAHHSDNMPIAVKALPAVQTDQTLDFFFEGLILSKFSHSNIVKFLGISEEERSILLVFELMNGGDIRTFIRDARPRRKNEISHVKILDLYNLAYDIANGCLYLEANKFIHRDIAARNCLLTEKGPHRVAKIGDFGMARDILGATYYRKTGKAMLPVKWMPPEAFTEGLFTQKTDVWGYGVFLWELFTMGILPYPGMVNQEVMKFVINGGRLAKPLLCSQELFELMTTCWKSEPTDRPAFSYIVDCLEKIRSHLDGDEEIKENQVVVQIAVTFNYENSPVLKDRDEFDAV